MHLTSASNTSIVYTDQRLPNRAILSHLRLLPPLAHSMRRNGCGALRSTTVVTTSSSATSLSSAGNQAKVQVEKTPGNSRRLVASVAIDTPPSVVWGALTDYQNLGNFIPGLVENQCLERRPDGARLLQVSVGGCMLWVVPQHWDV